jgi:hypothetical protein
MSGLEFYRTGMGRTFYEGTVPRIAKSLETIAEKLEGPQYSSELIGALIIVNELAMGFLEDSAEVEDPETLMVWKEAHQKVSGFINKIQQSQ